MPTSPRRSEAAEDATAAAVEQDAPWPASDTFTAGGPAISEPAPGTIEMNQASAAHIRARTVRMRQSAAGKVTASTVHLDQGASGFVRGTTVRVQDGALGALAADQVEFRDGFAFLVLARRVSGQVTVLFDWRGVAAATASLLVLGRLLRGRR